MVEKRKKAHSERIKAYWQNMKARKLKIECFYSGQLTKQKKY